MNPYDLSKVDYTKPFSFMLFSNPWNPKGRKKETGPTFQTNAALYFPYIFSLRFRAYVFRWGNPLKIALLSRIFFEIYACIFLFLPQYSCNIRDSFWSEYVNLCPKTATLAISYQISRERSQFDMILQYLTWLCFKVITWKKIFL